MGCQVVHLLFKSNQQAVVIGDTKTGPSANGRVSGIGTIVVAVDGSGIDAWIEIETRCCLVSYARLRCPRGCTGCAARRRDVGRRIDPSLPPPPSGGNVWGVKEDEILATGREYILIGNRQVHGSKKIMAQPHQEFALPFLRSRANHPELDRVWIWNG